jgi:hypothetical protein
VSFAHVDEVRVAAPAAGAVVAGDAATSGVLSAGRQNPEQRLDLELSPPRYCRSIAAMAARLVMCVRDARP